MSKFGWCFSTSEEARIDHEACPREIGAGPTILRCGCACHDQHEESA